MNGPKIKQMLLEFSEALKKASASANALAEEIEQQTGIKIDVPEIGTAISDSLQEAAHWYRKNTL